jgi:hypothetical protein
MAAVAAAVARIMRAERIWESFRRGAGSRHRIS